MPKSELAIAKTNPTEVVPLESSDDLGLKLENLEYHCEDCRDVYANMQKLTKVHNRILFLHHESDKIYKEILGHTHGAMVQGMSKRQIWKVAGFGGFLAASTLFMFLGLVAYWPSVEQSVISMMGEIFH